MHGLRDLRVIDFTGGIAGAYATKLFADAGADVIKVEPPGGDPLRAWTASDAPLDGEDGALFRFLCAQKRSIVGVPEDDDVVELVAGADLVVEDFEPGRISVSAWRERFPSLVHLSITPFGTTGPWRSRAATEFTIQAESGSIGSRGLPGHEPFQGGGRITEWVGGTFAAVGALAAVRGARSTGLGEHVDFSLLEVMTYAASNFIDLTFRLLGVTDPQGTIQSVETPSIEPTLDGFVGLCTNSAQQFSDLLLMIERPDLRDDQELFAVPGRMARFDEWTKIVHAYTRKHTTDEIVRAASLLRIPVAPLSNGETVQQHEHLVARGIFTREPDGGFVRPLPPYRIDGERPSITRPSPGLGEHRDQIESRRPTRPELALEPGSDRPLPLAGLRVLDLTAWWAGPSATHMLACLGAEVIHVEAIQRIDGMRSTGGLMAGLVEDWWEYSVFFLSSNNNKRGLTLNLTDPRGVELVERLVESSDLVVENFTPRVLDNFGLSWDSIQRQNPQTVFMRMPAFGLDGPWRDHTGFAQTMEQLSGLAWLTGHPDDQPRILRGPCDPLAGMHGAFALLVALAERDERGRGAHVEAAMIEGALNAAAEQLIEFSAYGNLLHREGNRSPHAAPQGLYPCAGSTPGDEQWLALSIETDAQWQHLQGALGHPAWAATPELNDRAGRRAAHDRIDEKLRRWFETRDRDETIEELIAQGVPAARVRDPRTTSANPQHIARGFYESVTHPVVGTQPTPTIPFRYASVERWIREPAPTLGQHNDEILRELGLDASEIDALRDAGVIGERPEGK